jgi:hypothetical protein
MSPKVEKWDERIFPDPSAYRPDPSPTAFNWWYNDADFDNGYMMVISYHFGLHRPPGDAERRFIEFVLHDPEGNRHRLAPRFSKEECTASEEMCHVVMRHNFCRAENGNYRVYFSEGELGCDLTYEPMVPGYQADLSALPGVSETFRWYMISIKSRVKGTIRVGGKTVDVCGYGYQEHAWDCVPMGLAGLENAFWGKIYQGDWSILWQGDTASGSLFVGKGNKMILESTKGSCHPFDFTTKDTRVERPEVIVFKVDDPGRGGGEIRFKVVKPILYADLLRRFKPFQKWFTEAYFGKAAYLRYRLKYDMNLRILGEKVTGKGVSWCEHHKGGVSIAPGFNLRKGVRH